MTKVGIKDIAAQTGVSIATVSHAFRNPGRVSEQTRHKVLEVAERLGYSPNHQAASLRTARSGNIVAIIPDITGSYNSRIINGIERVAHSRGYSVLLGNTQGSEEREKEYAAMTRSQQADGIILMSHRIPFNVESPESVDRSLPPLVNGSEFTGFARIPSVSIDDKQAAIDAVTHLLDLGHRTIGVVTGDMESTSSQNRMDGYRCAIREAGLEFDNRFVIHGEYTMEAGEQAARSLFAHKKKPTAVFCFSDEIAIGCLYTLRNLGLDVPNDVSVVGFDDVPYAKYGAPPLTTIAQPAEDIGSTCAMILLDMIDGKAPDRFRHILPHSLIVRDSTKTARRD